MIDYLPEWLREFREIKILCNRYQKQTEELWKAIEEVWNNNFIKTLNEHGCDRWERMLGIKNKDTYSLDDRKNNIAGRLTEQRPYTFKKLCRMLDTICGRDGYTIDVYPESYLLTVKVMLTSKNMFDDVRRLLDRVVPANIVTDVDLMYNVYKLLKPYTYDELRAYTCRQLREDVMK